MTTIADTHGAEAPATEPTLRIGEVAERTGVTPRTIRYWEEIGLLGAGHERPEGKHRLYTEADLERISEIVRLRNLLGCRLNSSPSCSRPRAPVPSSDVS